MHAVSDFRIGIGNELRAQPPIDGLPRFATVIGAKGAGGRDGNVNSFGILGIKEDGVQAHPAGAGLPLGAGSMAAQSGEFFPSLASISGTEQGSILHTRIDCVRIRK